MSGTKPELSIGTRIVTSIGAKVGGKVKISGTNNCNGEHIITSNINGKSILEKYDDIELVIDAPLKSTKPYFRMKEKW